MILRWFDSRAAVTFAKTVAQEIAGLVPPGKTATGSGKEIKKLERLFQRIYGFSRDNRLNLFTKARFLNTLRWELKERGYADSDIGYLTGIILPKL